MKFNKLLQYPLNKICFALTVIGTVVVMGSFGFNEYKDYKIIENAKMMDIEKFADSHAASEKYWEVRDTQLTSVYTIRDFGWTFLTLALIASITAKFYKLDNFSDIKKITTPPNYWYIIIIGFAAAFLSYLVEIYALLRDMGRDMFPPWADSLGIPFYGLSILLKYALVVVCGILLVGLIRYRKSAAICDSFRKNIRPFFLWYIIFAIPAALAILYAVISMLIGDYLHLAVAFVWFIFFLFLFTGHQKELIISKPEPPSL